MNKISQPLLKTLIGITLIMLNMVACKPGVDLPDLESASSIIISKYSGGLLKCDMTTFDKSYTLERTPDQFTGQADYEFCCREGFHATETLTIPQKTVQSFLAKLEEAQLKEGEFIPTPSCVDGVSVISIQINLECLVMK